jgi:glycosyltransferase involved in cell wall biosynthesis
VNVLHIATTLDGGAGIGLQRYHEALIQTGVHSRILVRRPAATDEAHVGAITRQKASAPKRLARRFGFAMTPEARMARALERFNSSVTAPSYELFTLPFSDYCPEDHPWVREADVINLHWVAGVLDWPRFFAKLNKPVVLTLHDQQTYLGGFHYTLDAANNPHLAPLEAEVRGIKKKALNNHRVSVVANSRWNAREARDSGFFHPEVPIEAIYYPIDTEVFRPRPREAAKSVFGISAARLVIGFACENLNNPRKGFAELLNGMRELPSSLLSRITLLSFGRDPSPELRARVNLPWVHLGFLNADVTKIAAYAAMDVFVAPSRAEAFGLTALEAQAVGIPVAASPCGGLAEALAPDVANDISPRSTQLSIVEQLVRFLTDASLRETQGAAGRRLAVDRHAPSAIGLQLADLHRRVIE